MNPSTCDNAVTNTGLLYLEKSFPEKEGHPPSRSNFNERVFEKKYFKGFIKCLYGETLARLEGDPTFEKR